jgi:hypothetical protein
MRDLDDKFEVPREIELDMREIVMLCNPRLQLDTDTAFGL